MTVHSSADIWRKEEVNLLIATLVLKKKIFCSTKKDQMAARVLWFYEETYYQEVECSNPSR